MFISRCHKIYILKITIILFLVGSLFNCRLLRDLSGPIPVDYAEESLTLSWDEEDSGIEGTPSALSCYYVYYRNFGSKDWIFLDSTMAPESSITIEHNTIGNGSYELAVQAVYNNEKRSCIHSSSDFSAWPSGGWYLRWELP